MLRNAWLRRSTLFFLSAGIWLLSLGLFQAELNISGYGLLTSFPAVFFIGAGIISATSILASHQDIRSRLGFPITFLVLVLALYLSPYLLEKTPRHGAGFWNFGSVEYLLRLKHLNPSHIVYHSWPGFAVHQAALMETTGISDPTTIMGLFPSVASILYAFLLISTYKRIDSTEVGRSVALIATLFLILWNWTNSNYYSPQGLAFVLFLGILWSLVRLEAGPSRALPDTSTPATLAVLLVSLCAVSVTHALTGVFAIALILLALALRGTLLRIQATAWIAISLLTAWTVYGAAVQFGIAFPTLAREMLSIDAFLRLAVGTRLAATSDEHLTVNILRVTYSLVLWGLVVPGFIALTRGQRRLPRPLRLLALTGVTATLITPFLVYGGEILTRIFFLTLPLSSYLAANLIRTRRGIVCLILVASVAPVALVATLYGNETIDYTTPTELDAAHFYYRHVRGGSHLTFDPLIGFRHQETLTQVAYWTSGYPPIDEIVAASLPDRLVLSRRSRAFYGFVLDRPREIQNLAALLAQQPRYHLVYSNTDVEVYSRRE